MVMVIKRKVAGRILEGALERPISAIIAPVASGKSELLRQVGERAAEAGRTCDSIAVGSDPQAALKAILDSLGRSEIAGHAPHLLLIDNFHRVPDAEAATILARAAEGTHISLVLASDRPLAVPVAGFRLQRKLAEYGMSDLAFTRQEAREMSGVGMAEVMSRDFQILVQATEGWVGAWQLIADRLANGESLTRIANDFRGNFGLFADYFEEEILSGFAPDLAEFITSFGIIAPLSIELASDLGGADARHLWDEARRSCPFLVQSVRSGRALNPHPMFRHFLAERLKARAPTAFVRLLKSAAEWFEKREDWPETIECLIAAGEEDLVAEKLRQNSSEIFARFGDATLLVSRGFVPERIIRQVVPVIRPEGALIQRRLDAGVEPEVLIRAGASADEQFKAILAYFGADRFEAVKMLADKWLQSGSQDPLQRAIVALTLSVSCYINLDHRAMRQALELGGSEVAHSSSLFIETWLALEWAMYHIEGARPAAARHAIEAVLDRSSARGVLRHTLEMVLAQVEYRLKRYESASELINRSLAPGSRHATVDAMVIGWTTAARCALRESGLDDALLLLDEAGAIVARRSSERGRLILRLLACQLCLQTDPKGRLSFVRQEIELIQANPAAAEAGRAFHEQLKIVTARLLYEQGEWREAISLIQPIMRRTESSERLLRWGEACLVRIAIAVAEGKIPLALRMFWDCESATTDTAISQLFLEEARLIAPLMPHLLAQVESSGFEARHRNYVREIAAAAGVASGDRDLDVDEDIPSDIRLTRIEKRIIDLVAKGLSNREIADRLSNSVPTVKWHLGNIFLKLGVKSRTAALIRLQALNLVG